MKETSWIRRPWNIIGLILFIVATAVVIHTLLTSQKADTCDQIDFLGAKFNGAYLLLGLGALFMDTPLRNFLSRLRGGSAQSPAAASPDAPASTPPK